MRGIYRRVASLAAVVLLGAVLSSCSGGGVSVVTTGVNSVRISSPTDAGTYQTDSASVSLSGASFTPVGAICNGIIGTMPAGYQVTWSNAANGLSGYASFYLGCLLQVNVIWSTGPIRLAIGNNLITVTATDSSGNTASATITVTRLADTTRPTVVSTSPVAGATGVAVNAALVATFSEAMDSASVNVGTITLKDNLNNPIAASVSYDALTLRGRLTPSSLLNYSTNYTATLTTGVRDAAGNALVMPYVFTFTTGANPDTTPPVIQSVSPAAGSTCASTSSALTVTFGEDMDPATVNASTFRLTGPGSTAVSGVVAYLNRTASFSPDTALAPVSAYTAALTTGMTDLAGNALAAPYQWNFTTELAQGLGTWAPTSLTGVPFARYGHAAVWTGSEMIVAGGWAWDSNAGYFDYTGQSGRYNPTTETWTLASGAPGALYQKAIWSGSRMLVFGGYNTGSAVTGGAQFDPLSNSWAALNTVNQPSARFDHTAVWTGNEMIVWGGRNGYGGTVYGNGARYNPVSNTWQAMSTLGAPSPRYGHTAIWTGSEMIVWGGVGSTGSMLSDGARYNPVTNTWLALTNTGAPTERYGHVALWTGSRMIIWGGSGSTNTGGLYDPVGDSWTATDTLCAPSGLSAPAVWTGSRMVFWGGATSAYGYEFDPVGNAWLKVTTTGAPSARFGHTAVWAGNRMIVWGGSNGTELNTGGLLIP